MSEKSDWSKFRVSEEVLKLMNEIEEKAENPETQLEALELIEANIGKLPYKAFKIVSTLTKSEDERIREKAKLVMEKYYEKYPHFKRFEDIVSMWAKLHSNTLGSMLSMYNIALRLEKTLLAFYNQSPQSLNWFITSTEKIEKINERLKPILSTLRSIDVKSILNEAKLPPTPPEVIVLEKLAEIEQKLEELKKDIEELKESKQIEKEEYERLKRKLKELEDELDRAYH